MGLIENNFKDNHLAADDFPNDILKNIYTYWLNIRGSNSLPSRADLNPADIVSLLPHICLIDFEKETGRYKYRLVGTETVKVMGFDATGHYMDQYPELEQNLKERYEWLIREKRPYLYFSTLKWSEKDYFEYYALGLPLSDNDRDVNILMYGMFYQFPKGHEKEFFSY